MDKNEHNQKHLTLSDRIFIEQELLQRSSFSSIAKALHKDPTTIGKEVKLRRTLISADKYGFHGCVGCMNRIGCKERNICGDNRCKYLCRNCWKRRDISDNCLYYTPWFFNKPDKPPYVCNACEHINHCKLDRARYVATKAQKQYEKTLSTSREGINMTLEELQELNELISPLVLKGQPLSHAKRMFSRYIATSAPTLISKNTPKLFLILV